MSSTESPAIRFLYNTRLGRLMLKALVRPQFSKIAYAYLSSPLSWWLINYYIRKHDINMSEYPSEKYRSFNDFFTRKRAFSVPEHADNLFIAPCDGFLSVHEISDERTFFIKHARYNLDSLLKDSELSQKYQNGCCLIFRLAPHNYHRYIFIDDGEIVKTRAIDGVLHCVRPEICTNLPVYVQNVREYALIKSEHFGDIIQMEIGALLVGRICNHFSQGTVRKFTEKGYFEFGGSTILLLIEKDRLLLADEIKSAKNHEIPVRSGQILGKKA